MDILIDDALDEIDGLRALGLSQRETEAVGRRLLSDSTQPYEETAMGFRAAMGEIDTSAFDVANAITAQARETSSVAARLSLEEVGHRYLSRRAA